MKEKSISKATIPSTKYEIGRNKSRDLESNDLPSIRRENMDQSSVQERKIASQERPSQVFSLSSLNKMNQKKNDRISSMPAVY